MRVIELFAGVGSQTQALKNLGIKHEVIGISEIDKYAINSYEQLHGTVNNFGDISKIDILPTADLWTYSFPCQDISIAGKQSGFDKEGNTRSGLLWEVERLLKVSEKPKYLLMENVKNLVSKKFKQGFDKWCECLEEMGYTNYYQVLNAKDFGVPQNRERVFMISILGEHKPYIFPEKQELKIRLKDLLENEVEEKYYLKSDKANQLIKNISEKFEIDDNTCCDMSLKNAKVREIANCLMARYDSGITDKQAEGTAVIQLSRGFNKGGIHNIVPTLSKSSWEQNNFLKNGLRIRKLTPKECWRLMGWKDEQFEKIHGISNTQLYKQAGNGIVVNVLEAIFKNLFQEQEDKCENCEKYNNFLCGKNGNYILPTMEIMMNCNR